MCSSSSPDVRPLSRSEVFVLVVDAQIHLFGTKDRSRPGLRIMSPEEVIAEMDSAGVDRAYVVPAGTDANQASLDAAARWPDRFRVMGIPRLNKPEGRKEAANWQGLGYLGA